VRGKKNVDNRTGYTNAVTVTTDLRLVGDSETEILQRS
jgi:hypothetical protein